MRETPKKTAGSLFLVSKLNSSVKASNLHTEWDIPKSIEERENLGNPEKQEQLLQEKIDTELNEHYCGDELSTGVSSKESPSS